MLLTLLSLFFMFFIVVPSLVVVDLVVILHVIVVPSHVAVDLADILAVVVAAAVDVWGIFPTSLAICV